MSESEKNISNADDYHRLLYRNQGRIYAYILSLVGNYADADDIMQDTISVMWRKFSDFEMGSDFFAWGAKIAHFKILEYRRKKQKQEVVQYNDELFEELPSRLSLEDKHFDDLSDILKKCLKKLHQRYFTVIKLRYFEETSPKDISGRTGLSMSNVYQLLSRAHGHLLVCMKKTMSFRDRLS